MRKNRRVTTNPLRWYHDDVFNEDWYVAYVIVRESGRVVTSWVMM
jgi:hypothetical protein